VNQTKTKNSWGSAIGSGAVTFVTLAFLVMAGLLVVAPKIMGGMSLTVLTGSMEPGIMPGDIVVTKGIDEAAATELSIGDVIVFLPFPDDPTLVTHRIMAKTVTADGVAFVTQGDNNSVEDPWNPVQPHQIRGEVAYVVPKVGFVAQWVGPYTAWLIPAVGGLILGYAVLTFARSFRKEPSPETAPEP